MGAEDRLQATWLDQYKIMVWKNFLLKRRNMKYTLYEFILPLYMVAILAIIRATSVQDAKPPIPMFPEYPTTSPELITVSLNSSYRILVSPDSDYTKAVMNEVVSMSLFTLTPEYYPSSEDAVTAYNTNTTSVFAGIQFNYSGTGDLSYALRMSDSSIPNTDDSDIYKNQASCRDDDTGLGFNCDVIKYLRSGFSQLQMLIDTAIIRNKTGYSGFPLANTSIQMLPKPAYLQDTSYIQTISSIYFVIAFTPLINIMTVLIVTEKEKKIKEGMKMMGLRSSVFWFSWSTVYFVIITAVAVAMTIIAVAAKFFQNSNMFLFFIMIWLYGLSIMSISFLMTPFFNKAQTAGGVATMTTMLTSLLYLIVSQTRTYEEGTGSASYDVPVYGRWLLCIMSPTALSLGIDQAVYLDVRGGMTFSSASEGEFPLYGPIIMLLLDTLVYFLLAMYLDLVIPGEYGPRQKPTFFCSSEFWFPKKKEIGRDRSFSNQIYDENDVEEPENPDIEPVPQYMKGKAAVKIQRLSKIFKTKKKDEEDVKAVNSLSVTMYEDQITAILGHNGAGKTTLINILTGMTGATSGSATIFGLDVSNTSDMANLREMTGVCPQHNILFDLMTCAEHLRLFASLKGVPADQVEKEVHTALESVDLKEKANEKSQTLSGGQKRKLSVAIAIIGDPKIIILDEPTAGMDPYSRRHLWGVLKEKKKGRIILLTTHFMDEADILADRKAIVNKGSLRSCGSSLFLENRFGLGYHLNMVVEPTCDTGRVCEMVASIVPGSEINRIHGKELDITMPHDGVVNFAGLFSKLEEESTLKSYGVKNYGVSMTTLEEVFLKLEEDLETIELEENGKDNDSPYKKNDDKKLLQPQTQAEVDIDSSNGINPSDTINCLEGMDLTMQRYKALCLIRMIQTLRRGVTLFWKFFVPVGLLIGGLIVSKNLTKNEQDKTLAKTKPLFINPGYYASLVNGEASFPYGTVPKFLIHDTVKSTDSIAYTNNISSIYRSTKYLPQYTNDSFLLLDKTVAPHYMGVQVDQFDTTNSQLTDLKYKMWYNDSAIHAIPGCINLINNFLFKSEKAAAGMPANNESIEVTNNPWPTSGRDEFQWNSAAFLAVLLIGMAFSYIPGAFGPNVVADRECKARSQLRVSGVSFAMYWSTYFTVDFVVFLIPAVLCIICIFAIGVDAFSPPGATSSVVLLCLCYLPSNILFSYFLSFAFDKTETAEGVMPGFYGMLGYLPYFPVSIVDMVSSQSAATIMHTIFCILFPPYNLFGGLYYVNKIYTNHLWTFTTDQIPSSEYFEIKSNIPTAYICSLLHVVIFFFLLRLLDIYKTGGDIRETCFMKGQPNIVEPTTPTNPRTRNEDEDVTTERMRVKGLQKGVIGKEFPVAIAEDLRKEFKKEGEKSGGCKKKPKETKIKVAVHDTTFAVDAGEVFGLLGPNGAGKTTTLNMMTADVGPDRGRVIVGGHDINSAMSDAFQAMGYCPQHDALWNTITLKEHLDCYARIRGIPTENHNEVTNYFIENLKLDEHKDKRSKKLSGGTKRKLSYGMSMLGRPKIVMLDEPSTGMDPQSKRFLWDTISNSFQNSERGAILTTHYMEEADALCSRIAIMVNGKIECIGSNQHLKNKYGSGYLLELKIKQEEDSSALSQKMGKLKTFVVQLFPDASVMEQFSERVQYKVPKSNVTSLAKVFSTLEEGKSTLDIAEYSFSQSTLEQVFLEFAKMQLDEGEASENEEISHRKSLMRSMSQHSDQGPDRV